MKNTKNVIKSLSSLVGFLGCSNILENSRLKVLKQQLNVYKMVLDFGSVDETLKCDNSNLLISTF